MSRILSTGGGGMCAWQRVYMARGIYIAGGGGMHDRGHASRGTCVALVGVGEEACMEVGVYGRGHAWQEASMPGECVCQILQDMVNGWAVRILVGNECDHIGRSIGIW